MKQSTAINQIVQAGRRLDRDSDDVIFDQPLSGPRRRIRMTTALPARELPTLAPRATPPASLDPILRARGSFDVTHRVRRPPPPTRVVPRTLAIAALSLASVAAFALTYRILHTRTAGASVAAALAQPAPTISPITPAADPPAALVDFQLASDPAGATVTLLDDGHPTLLGTTPLTAPLDPSRAHELLFALDGHAPKTAHLAAHATGDISVHLPRARRPKK